MPGRMASAMTEFGAMSPAMTSTVTSAMAVHGQALAGTFALGFRCELPDVARGFALPR